MGTLGTCVTLWNTAKFSSIDSEHHQKMTVCQEASQTEAKGFALWQYVDTSKHISKNDKYSSKSQAHSKDKGNRVAL